MDEEKFWRIIDEAYKQGGRNELRAVKYIKQHLSSLAARHIEQFQSILEEKMGQLDTWDCVNAMAIMYGDVSDDLFEYWRAGLILRGRNTFESALNDVENLASDEEINPCENFLYAADQVWERVTGVERAVSLTPPIDQLVGTNPVTSVAQLKSRYPKLTARFWGKWPRYSPYEQSGERK